MAKFNIGDRVVHRKGIPYFGIKPGTPGIVVESVIPRDGETAVRFEKNELFGIPFPASLTIHVRDEELEPAVKPEPAKAKPAENKPVTARRVVIDITDDGAFARYIEGKKTLRRAAIKRYREDTPHDPTAAMYAVRKLWPKSFDKDGDTYVNKLMNQKPAPPTAGSCVKKPELLPEGFIGVTDMKKARHLVNVSNIRDVRETKDGRCDIFFVDNLWFEADESFETVTSMIAEAVKD